MNNLVRFTVITVVVIAAGLGVLAVGGALSSSELWKNLTKVLELAGIMIAASGIILFVSKK